MVLIMHDQILNTGMLISGRSHTEWKQAASNGFRFLRATAGTAIARLSHHNILSVCLSVTGKNGAS